MVIDGLTVSRRHARITISAGAAVIEDLGSTSGVHVEGQRIAALTRIVPGNPFTLGTESISLLRRGPSVQTLKVDPGSKKNV